MNHSRSRSGCGGTGARLRSMLAPRGAAGSSAAKRLRNVVVDQGLRVGEVLRVALAPQRLIDVDVLLESERRIEHRLHALRAMRLDGLLDLAGVAGGVLDDALADLLLAAAEQQVVAREIRVPEHVGGDQNVLSQPVARRRDRRAPGCRETPPRTAASGPCAAG